MTGNENTHNSKKEAPAIYKTLGERIKSIRDSMGESGLSRTKFCIALNSANSAPVDMNGNRIELKEETLKKWERGENQVNLLWLPAISEIGSCDYSFLFGESECKTKDLQGVCDYTGLTESAVEQLHFYTKPGFQHIAEMLSSLISDEYFVERDTKEISSTIHVLADNISYLRQAENAPISYGERDEMEFYKAGAFGKCQLAFMGFVERYTRFQGLEDKKT